LFGSGTRNDVEALTWDDDRHRWCGHATVDGNTKVEVAVVPGDGEPAVALAYARLAFSRLVTRLDKARQFAARKLVPSYNYYNAHLQDGEQVSESGFARRLRLARIRFRGDGAARLDFGHDMYPGDYLYAGGLVVIQVTAEGRFRSAGWVSKPDADDLH
jgi:hypothetical protein